MTWFDKNWPCIRGARGWLIWCPVRPGKEVAVDMIAGTSMEPSEQPMPAVSRRKNWKKAADYWRARRSGLPSLFLAPSRNGDKPGPAGRPSASSNPVFTTNPLNRATRLRFPPDDRFSFGNTDSGNPNPSAPSPRISLPGIRLSSEDRKTRFSQAVPFRERSIRSETGKCFCQTGA